MRVLFAEDNADYRTEITFQLEVLGHSVESVGDGAALLSILEAGLAVDVLLLDLGLPDWDGVDLARKLKTLRPELPIVMLTARVTVAERAEGWAVGARAYLNKPVALKELDAVLQGIGAAPTSQAEAHWTLVVGECLLCNPSGETVAVTVTERRLLTQLIDASPEPVSREVLVTGLGEELLEFDMRRLEAAVSRLRRKLQTLGADSGGIRSARGAGYLLVANIKVK